MRRYAFLKRIDFPYIRQVADSPDQALKISLEEYATLSASLHLHLLLPGWLFMNFKQAEQ